MVGVAAQIANDCDEPPAPTGSRTDLQPQVMVNMQEIYGVDLADAALADLERKFKLRGAYREPVPPHVFMRG